MNPGIVIGLSLLGLGALFVGIYYFDRWMTKRWAKEAAERIWERRDEWLRRG